MFFLSLVMMGTSPISQGLSLPGGTPLLTLEAASPAAYLRYDFNPHSLTRMGWVITIHFTPCAERNN